jgi:8-hydroxy-5-deazaflavin:NADPH oxidoreductase
VSAQPVIAIVGGTGDIGSGLATRWIGVGHSIVIGSRSGEKARMSVLRFSKGKMSENLRGRPYDLEMAEVADRVAAAWQRGAS